MPETPDKPETPEPQDSNAAPAGGDAAPKKEAAPEKSSPEANAADSKAAADKPAAAATRRKVLGMLAADRVPFIGYHMPFPALGFVEPRGDGFRYVPATYQLQL